ncbi:hypothetical protein [Mesorhizobium sp. 1B3]|uniref:hypothetical protein n=1 Tax=Mesorhizobium sp. 1B3 TaxID=3243599 RepID=UPI003D965565
MPRKPNYDFERKERERAKAAKKAEKLAAKAEAREHSRSGDDGAPAQTGETEK